MDIIFVWTKILMINTNCWTDTFFQPDYTLTINDMTMGIKKDVPIILNDISYEDSYQEIFKRKGTILYYVIYL